ncbi:MAG: caspase domain-containing protein [Polyangiaceae bacterium]
MRFQSFVLALFLLAFTFLASRASAQGPPAPLRRRVGIVVGANAPPPGRTALRFAHEDAREMADVLARVGRFAPGDVHLLLDPTPAELLYEIDDVARSAQDDAMVLFYYSGHSDGQSLYPHGEALPVTEVRDRLANMAARVRVGILDTCRGGNWTQAKGVTVGPPLDPVDLLNVSTEGTALVSSSSGFEAAHEGDDAHGSFFTHYFASGLLGAADTNGDGEVTLEEAYDYARERTVRDSARLAPTPQHPSFDLQLRGRQDIVLASLRGNTSAIEIDQPSTMIEVIHLPTGITLAEVPPSSRAVRIAVPPARYLVRRVEYGRVYSKEVEVAAGETVTLAPGQLEATGTSALAMKGGSPDPHRSSLSLWSSTPGQHWLLNLSVGMGTQYWPMTNGGANAASGQYSDSVSFGAHLWYRITDRLSWSVPFPAFSYRFGNPGGVEVMTFMGLKAGAFSGTAGPSVGLGTDVAVRIWTASNQRVTLGAGVYLPAYKDSGSPMLGAGIGNDVDPSVRAGYSWTIQHLVTLNAELGYVQNYYLGNLSSVWVQPRGSIDIRVSPQASLNFGVLYSDEVHQNLGSFENFTVGTTLAF